MVVKAESNCLLTLKGIDKFYQQLNDQEIMIIANISIALRTKLTIAFSGLLGSVKSSFMGMITELITPTPGEILAHNHALVTEYIDFKGRIVSTRSLGSTISQATASGISRYSWQQLL